MVLISCLMSEAAEGFILLARVHKLVAQSVSTWKTILYSIYIYLYIYYKVLLKLRSFSGGFLCLCLGTSSKSGCLLR